MSSKADDAKSNEASEVMPLMAVGELVRIRGKFDSSYVHTRIANIISMDYRGYYILRYETGYMFSLSPEMLTGMIREAAIDDRS